jgi:hypothetical protein
MSPLVSFSGYNPDFLMRQAFVASLLVTLYDICLPLNLIGNSMMWGTLSLTAYVHGAGKCIEENMLAVNAICFVTTSVLIILGNVVFTQMVEHEMHMLTTQSVLKASDSILQGICDAVIVIDHELKVIDGAQSVANMLMMTPSKIHGESVLSLIPAEDRERFAGMVRDARSSATPGPCTAFNASLKDSVAISCNVEALCVKFLQAGSGDELFLIGFREAPDLPAAPLLKSSPNAARQSRRSPPQPPPAAGLAEPPQGTGSARCDDDLAAQDGISNGASFSSGRSSDSDDACAPTVCQSSAVWFDPSSPEFDLVKSSVEFRMLTGFTEEEMADVGGVLTWVRSNQRDDFASWVRNVAASAQSRQSRHCDAVSGVKLCITCEKHRAQFQAEVHLMTCWPKVTSNTLKLVVRVQQKTNLNTRKAPETLDASSDADEFPSHKGGNRARSCDFEVRDSGLKVEFVLGVGEDPYDPMMITRRISPGLQLLLGTADTGQDMCDLFSSRDIEHLETWFHNEYMGWSGDGQTDSTTSLWCGLTIPALATLGIRLKVNCRLTFQEGASDMCLVIQKMRWLPRIAKVNSRSAPKALGTPARADSVRLRRLRAAGDVESL